MTNNRSRILRLAGLLLAFAAAACGQLDLRGPAPAAAGVPYGGATRDVDLGSHQLSAGGVRLSRIHLSQGVCPDAPGAGYDAVVCLEGAALYVVTAAGKVPLTVKQPAAQVEAFPLSGLKVDAQGVATIMLAKTPAPGTLVRISRFSSVAGEYIAKDMVANGREIQVMLPSRAFVTGDVIEVAYGSVE